MTTFDRDPLFDPRISDWLEDDPDHAPDVVLETVAAAFPSIPQRRARRAPRRFPTMSMPTRVAAAAAIGVLLVGGAVYLITPSSRSNVGPPGPSPSTVSTPGPSPSPSASEALLAAPARSLGDWQAMSDQAIPGLFGANEQIQLSIDWQDGLHTWIQTVDGSGVLKSASGQASADEIRLVSTSEAEAVGCTEGQAGTYRWSRSADGMFLTLTAIDDGCANRVAAMSRTWVHSLSAVTDGGLGVIPLDDAWLKATVPDQRFGLSGNVDYIDLSSMEGPDRHLYVLKDPYEIDQPCGTARQPRQLLDTTARFDGYVRTFPGPQTLPGYKVTTTQATVGGQPAIHVTTTPIGSPACLPDGTIVPFHAGPAAGPRGELGLSANQVQSMWMVVGSKDPYLFVYQGSAVTPAEEASVMASIQFLDKLPVP